MKINLSELWDFDISTLPKIISKESNSQMICPSKSLSTALYDT